VGGTNLLTVDVRVVSATNKDLREEVKGGRFREDLLYRLNVITLQVPLLCDRKEDIPVLADYFLQRKAKTKNVKKLSPSALRVLMEYEWPGNVRELEHALEGAVLLCTGETIEVNDLAMHFHRSDRPALAGESPGAGPAGDSGSLEELERDHIERMLRQYKYSRTKTADALGISKKTLYLKIKRYGLKVED
jgi:DNA-binding NtrC family response regulator